MKLSGWHRLWILLSAIYFFLVASYVIVTFPKPESITHQPEFHKKLSKKSAGMITSNNVEDVTALGGETMTDSNSRKENEDNVKTQEHGPWEDYQKALKKEWDEAKPIDFHPIVAMPNKHTIEFKKDYKKEEMEAVSSEYWHIVGQKVTEKRLFLMLYAFFFWLLPCLALYALGWCINWVYKGFKS